MPTDSIKLHHSFFRRLLLAVIATAPIVLIFIRAKLKVYIWIFIVILAVLAVNYWIRLFWPDTIVEISEKGIWYQEEQEKWFTWEDILSFQTVRFKDLEGWTVILLVLKTRHRFMDIRIDLTKLRTNETQIREWIKKYAGTACPVDEGHSNL